MRNILPYAASVIALALGAGSFTSPISADSGSGGGRGGSAVRVKWLGTLGGNSSQAYEASSNGSVIVGYSSNPSGYYRAFRWTATGMRDLSTLYPSGSGSYLQYANAVSADGLKIVGYGYNRQKLRYEAFSTN